MKKLIAAICCSLLAITSLAQRKLNVATDKVIAAISPTMWGVFFEDINFAADGGLYAELIKNRSFEFPTPMMGWKENRANYQKGRILIINNTIPAEANSRFARITINNSAGNYSLSNDGFRGIGLHKDKQYEFNIMARTENPGSIKLNIQLLNSIGKLIGSARLENIGTEWKNYTASIITTDSAMKGQLNLEVEGKGIIDIDVVSLFPKDTWKNRPGGLRQDIVQKIADLKPGFIRFPGGCIVEGKDLENRYQWKTTVGDVNDRKLIMNRWNVEFRHRPAPDYYQSFGVGFYEYFLLAEDLGAAPLPILNCGMACQFNSGEVVAMDALDPYIKDALDLIEFANGDVNSKWGKLRSDMGHPQPFNLIYLGVGNEQWEPQYIERYKVFEKAILDKYPNIKIVSGAGPYAEGEYFNYAWKELKQLQPSLIDEHYYKPPSWFFKNAARYDSYERKGPRIFAGEYAAHSKENEKAESRNNWESALAEAAFMTGLERNADIVQMCSYAPLLAHTDAWQWRPDLIWFDNLRTVATPNYYVQQLFSVNKGTEVISISEAGKAITGADSLYASAVIDKNKKEIILKMVNAGDKEQFIDLVISGMKLKNGAAVLETLSGADLYSYNTLEDVDQLKPVSSRSIIRSNKIQQRLPAYSVNVMKINYVAK